MVTLYTEKIKYKYIIVITFPNNKQSLKQVTLHQNVRHAHCRLRFN